AALLGALHRGDQETIDYLVNTFSSHYSMQPVLNNHLERMERDGRDPLHEY
ncbi:unnamed protein product, partial [Polarella glacialis]